VAVFVVVLGEPQPRALARELHHRYRHAVEAWIAHLAAQEEVHLLPHQLLQPHRAGAVADLSRALRPTALLALLLASRLAHRTPLYSDQFGTLRGSRAPRDGARRASSTIPTRSG